MDIIKAIAPATVVLALTLAPLPASAQARPRASGDRVGTAVERGARTGPGVADQRGADVRGSAAVRGGVARAGGGGGAVAGGVVRGGAPAMRGGPAPRAGAVVRGGGPRGGAAMRGGPVRGPAPRQQYYLPQAQGPRGYVVPRYYGRPSYGAAYRPRFERPYYVFRPRTHVGFGLWLGFGVPYPRAYIVEYPPPVYGYYGGRFGVVPGARYYGGISFDIAPDYAPVYVDGTYVGAASDFGPYAQPLTLVPGLHRVMISVGGYRPISWNVTVVAGQVIPFRGSMVAY